MDMARRDPSALLLVAVILVTVGIVIGKEIQLEEPVLRTLNLTGQDADKSPEHKLTFTSSAIPNELFGKQKDIVQDDARTFGHKRIQFMMMPMIYKMGVMITMIGVLTVISLKGLLIGVTLLILKLSTIFGKLFSNIHDHSSSWSPHQQPIHLHLHSSGPYETHSQTFGAWEPPGGIPHENYYYKG